MYKIVHDIPGRMRIRYGNYAFDKERAVGLKFYVEAWPMVTLAETNYKTGSILFEYDETQRDALIEKLDTFDYNNVDFDKFEEEIEEYRKFTLVQKETTEEYIHKGVGIVVRRYLSKWFLPMPVQNALGVYHSIPFIWKGIKSLLSFNVAVPVLDAASISASMLIGDFKTSRDIMFLLNISGLLEDYTTKKATLQLKETLSMHHDQVWVRSKYDGTEKEIPMELLEVGDTVIVQMGAMIPIDGEIIEGEAMINESSFTGEPLAKAVGVGDSVFSGTLVEEGKLFIKVRNLQEDSRINMIVDMINTNEKMKATVQANAEHLADSLVPFSFIGFFGLWAFSRSLTRAYSILMVDYSCAIKLSTSISIIAAMQEAGEHDIMIKGGKYLEIMSKADTIVFDKTGTLTNATPYVQDIYPVGDYTRDEVLRLAACLEEHFPHSVANAIVLQAEKEGLKHKEEHAKVDYIIAHGIASTLYGKKTVIGSEHFVFEDESVERTAEIDALIESMQRKGASSFIYLAVGGKLEGIISIYDPLKDEAKDVIQALRNEGFEFITMLTGDCENAAYAVANEVGLDHYEAGVLPEDKSGYIMMLQDEGYTVVMVGDGVNDTPALSCSDVSISMMDSSDIARELADVTLVSSSLNEIVVFKKLAKRSMHRINTNYKCIVAFNTVLIILGVMQILTPGMSALLHNASTFGITLASTRPLLKEEH